MDTTTLKSPVPSKCTWAIQKSYIHIGYFNNKIFSQSNDVRGDQKIWYSQIHNRYNLVDYFNMKISCSLKSATNISVTDCLIYGKKRLPLGSSSALCSWYPF